MSEFWKDRNHVVSDLDQLCDMYEPRDARAPIPDIKLLTMEKNPSPETVADPIYLPDGIDLTDDELDIQPDFSHITAQLREVQPSFNNHHIEVAFGRGGLLLDQSRRITPPQSSRCSQQKSTGYSRHIPVTDGYGDTSLSTQLNPNSGEFVPLSHLANVPSGDRVLPRTPEKKLSATKLNPHTPEFKPSGLNRYNNDKSVGSAKPSTSSVTVNNVSSPGKNKTKSKSYRHPAPEASSNVANQKMKRNCAMQNMFQRFVEGESADTISNIEINSKFGAQKQSADFNPATMNDGNGLSSKSPIENKALENLAEIFGPLHEIDKDPIISPRKPVTRQLYGFVETHPAPSNDPPPGPSHGYNKHTISSDSKNKVLSWLSSDSKTSKKKDAYREVLEPPKPKPLELDDEAFTFIKRNPPVPESVQTASTLVTRKESISEKRIVNSEAGEASAAQAQSPQPKKPTVEDIYNSLKAKQERRTAINRSNATGTYESFIGNDINTPSSNTVWDNIKVTKSKSKHSKQSTSPNSKTDDSKKE